MPDLSAPQFAPQDLSRDDLSQDKVASPVCFGKVPAYGDFVRCNARGSTVRSIERWFQEGLYNLRARLRHDALGRAYDDAPTQRFVFCPTASSTLLVGALRMSRDEGGRRYPFAVAADVDKNLLPPRRTSILPLCDASFLDSAARLAENAARGAIRRAALPQHIETLAPARAHVPSLSAQALRTAETELDTYFRATSFHAFAERLWGDFDDSRKYLVLRNLLASLGPVRRTVPARFSLGLRFPLSSRAAAAKEVGFWVKLSLRLLDAANVTPTFFWSVPPGAAENAGTLLLFFRPPPPRVFAHLLSACLESDNICELERSGQEEAARVVLALPARHGRLLESETVTLWEFLNHF